MTQDMTATILTDEIAQISPQTHIRHGAFMVSPFLNGDALEEDESFAIEEILAQFD